MATTVTKKSGPGVIGSIGEAAIFMLTPDASWLAAGEAIDLTNYFSEIHWAGFGGVTAINGHKMDVVIPADGNDIAAGTVLVTAHYSTDAAGAMTAVPDTTDLSSFAEMRLLVIGKRADTA